MNLQNISILFIFFFCSLYSQVRESTSFSINAAELLRIKQEGYNRTYNLGTKKNNTVSNISIPEPQVIYVWEIDTSQYSNIYKYWQRVEVANTHFLPLPVGDLNNNNRPELYGISDATYPVFGPVVIYEQDNNLIFHKIFSFDTSSIGVNSLADVNGDGKKEIFFWSIDNNPADVKYYKVFKGDSTGLPTLFDFQFYQDTVQINDIYFGDWDNNGVVDCVFATNGGWDTTRIAIAEYRSEINNYEELFSFKSLIDENFSGFAIDDFNMNGRKELICSSLPGNVYIIESNGLNNYSIINQFSFPMHNSYMQAQTNDIDGNGKPEFWIGGQDFESGITLFQCYESDSDNTYKTVAAIELRYINSFFNFFIQGVDIDDDGKDELVISIANTILILEFAGKSGDHFYKIWYAKSGETSMEGAIFEPVTFVDLNNDGAKDLVIPMSRSNAWNREELSLIYLRNIPAAGVETSTETLDQFKLYQNYPNPFNPSTTISYNLQSRAYVKMYIYNSQGELVDMIVNQEQEAGYHEIRFNAASNKVLASAIYFYEIIAIGIDHKAPYKETKKMIFLK